MKLQSDPMTTKVANNSVMIFIRVFFYRMTYISNKRIWLCSFHTYFKTFLCHTHKLFFLGCCLTDNEHTRCISIISIKYSSEININYITFFQYVIFLWNTMTNYFIDACTYTFRITLIAETRRHRTMSHTIIMTYCVYFKCTHTHVYMLCHLIKDSGIHDTAFSYTVNLFRSFYQITSWHFLTLVLPIHHFLIKLCKGLSW